MKMHLFASSHLICLGHSHTILKNIAKNGKSKINKCKAGLPFKVVPLFCRKKKARLPNRDQAAVLIEELCQSVSRLLLAMHRGSYKLHKPALHRFGSGNTLTVRQFPTKTGALQT